MPIPSGNILTRRAVLLLGMAWAAFPAAARDTRPAEASSPGEVKPGSTRLLKSSSSAMRYFLRVPKKYDAAKGARLIVFLHGSGMNGLEYLRSFEAKKWCGDDILCCPNGENGGDPFGVNNFGFGSGPLVAGITEEVQKAFRTSVTYIGGHSQGAFVTYSVILNFPALYRGAFPIAGDCWMQNEPNLWEDRPEILSRQKEIAIAVIHGKADPVVAFSQGEHAYDCFRAMGWTKLRLFAPEKLNHMFMLSPVEEAIEWLDAMNGRNERRSAALAAKWGRDGEWGWAVHAAGASPNTAASLPKAAETAALKALPAMREAMKGPPALWVPKWVEFWRVYGVTEAAAPVVDEYLAERGRQRETAARLFAKAQTLLNEKKSVEANEVLENLRDRTPNTYQGFFAMQWLASKK